MSVLIWEFDDQGEWVAPSALKDVDGDAIYQYRIQVCGDGTFDTNATDGVLLAAQECTATLGDAKARCDRREAAIGSDVRTCATDLDASAWRKAYEDAFRALKGLNECCGQEIAEYEPPEDVQTVLWLNGRVHSVDGQDVPSPTCDQSPTS